MKNDRAVISVVVGGKVVYLTDKLNSFVENIEKAKTFHPVSAKNKINCLMNDEDASAAELDVYKTAKIELIVSETRLGEVS